MENPNEGDSYSSSRSLDLQQFRGLTENELEESFLVENEKDRIELMRAVNLSRQDYSDEEDEDNEVGILKY